MYAVIKTGGKQYRVSQGDVLQVEKLPGAAGDNITFDEVLLVGGDGPAKIGRPVVRGAKVAGQILEQGRDKKIIVFKFRRRKNYRRKTGHRQAFTAVKITEIQS